MILFEKVKVSHLFFFSRSSLNRNKMCLFEELQRSSKSRRVSDPEHKCCIKEEVFEMKDVRFQFKKVLQKKGRSLFPRLFSAESQLSSDFIYGLI